MLPKVHRGDSDACGLPGCAGNLPNRRAIYCSKSCRQKANYHRRALTSSPRIVLTESEDRFQPEWQETRMSKLPPTILNASQPGPWVDSSFLDVKRAPRKLRVQRRG